MDPSLATLTSSSGDYRQALFPTNARDEAPYEAEEDDILEPHAPASAKNRVIRKRPLFSLKNNTTKRPPLRNAGNWPGRVFDYDQKYEADEWGAEMGPESRFCKMFVDECEIYDLERIESWRDVLDVLLVFIGLFSAIVTTFVVQTSQALQPDYGQITAALVYNLVLVQRALENGTTISIPAPQNPAEPVVISSWIDTWVNGLWFTSLTISLSTALITVLTKQWLHRYMSQASGTSKDRARLRQFRFAGLEKYRVPLIIDLLPIALHVALALFLIGLALFLASFNIFMSVVVIIISGVAYSAYIVSAVLPLFDPQCPYQSPISIYLHQMKDWAILLRHKIEKAIASSMLWCIKKWAIVRGSPIVTSWDTPSYSSPMYDMLSKRLDDLNRFPAPPSLQAQGQLAVLENCDQLDIDAISWIHSTSSNSTVREISIHAVAGLPPSRADMSKLDSAVRKYCAPHIHTRESYRLGRILACVEGLEGLLSFVHDISAPDEDENYRVFNSLVVPALSLRDYRRPTQDLQRSALHLGHFLADGPHAHIRFPLSTWRLVLTELESDSLIPALVTHVLSTARPILGMYNAATVSPSTLADALNGNEHLLSVGLKIIGRHLGLSSCNVYTAHSIPFLLAIGHWALTQLDAVAGAGSEWGCEPRRTALAILLDSFDIYQWDDLSSSRPDTLEQIRDVAMTVIAHLIPYPGWGDYSRAIWLIRRLWAVDRPPPCPPELFLSLLAHLERSVPETETTADLNTYTVIPTILQNMVNQYKGQLELGMFYDMMREQDVLPLPFTKSSGDKSHRLRVWSYDMCEAAVFAMPGQVVPDLSVGWVAKWIEYIDCEERIAFIFKCMLKKRETPLGRTPDSMRPLSQLVAPLISLTKNSPHWALCFPWLIALLEDDVYLDSIPFRAQPVRYELSNLLVLMQNPDVLPFVDLSMHTVPRFDESGCSLPTLSGDTEQPGHGIDHIHSAVDVPAVESVHSDHPDLTAIGTLPLNTAGEGALWRRTRNVVRFVKMASKARSPKTIEEAVEFRDLNPNASA